MDNGGVLARLFVASLINTRNVDIPRVPTTNINEFIAALLRSGWRQSCMSYYGMDFRKKILVGDIGEVEYHIHIDGRTNLKEMLNFISCKLLGPSLNTRTGLVREDVLIGEWKTVKGVSTGLPAKYKQSRDALIAKAIPRQP